MKVKTGAEALPDANWNYRFRDIADVIKTSEKSIAFSTADNLMLREIVKFGNMRKLNSHKSFVLC